MGALLNGEYMKNPFKRLTKFELALWLCSLGAVTISFILGPDKDILSLIASSLGVTALIFVAKGMVLGQALCVVFSLLYGVISFKFRYYGEVITYVGMSAPAAVAAVIAWIKNPYGDGDEVKVSALTRKKVWGVAILTLAVTVAFYFILGALGTANLIFSTLSVATSMLASSLVFLRSPYYALAYAANDVVLIVLWVLAAMADIAYLPMILCFIAFLANDVYGFISWRRMRKRQGEG